MKDLDKDELRKAKRYDSLLHIHKRSLVKIARLQDEINTLSPHLLYYQKRVSQLERLVQTFLTEKGVEIPPSVRR